MAGAVPQVNANPLVVIQIPPATNWMGKYVRWFYDEKTDRLQRILARALSLIALIAIPLVLPPFLIASVFLVIWHESEKSRFLRVKEQALRDFKAEQKQQEGLRKNKENLHMMQEAVGGKVAFERLPFHFPRQHRGFGEDFDIIQPGDMRASIMKTSIGESGILLKLRHRVNQTIGVVTFYRLYGEEGAWRERGHYFADAFNGPDRESVFREIRQVVVEKNHPILELVV